MKQSKKHKNKPLGAKKINSFLGLLIIILFSLIVAYAVWNSSWKPWEELINLTPNETADLMVLLATREANLAKKDVPIRLSMGKYKGTPNITKNLTKYDKILKAVSAKNNLDCTLVKAQMLAESRGNAKAHSNRGAIGLMQLMPLTARAMGVTGNLYDPKISLEAGARYINHLLKTACHEKQKNEVCNTATDYKFIFAAYNGGSKANDTGLGRCKNVAAWECLDYEAYFETRVYVNRVKANYDLMMDNNWGC